MHRYEFSLRVSAEQYLEYYRGTIRDVIVRAKTGQRVQFPASLLQRFVTPDGITGEFALTCDAQHKNPTLERIG